MVEKQDAAVHSIKQKIRVVLSAKTADAPKGDVNGESDDDDVEELVE